MFQRRHFDKV